MEVPIAPDADDEPVDVGERPVVKLPLRYYSRPDLNSSDAELEAWADAFIDGVMGLGSGTIPDWIDPNGGPESEDELDPDIHPDPTADDPPWADQELKVDNDEDQSRWIDD